jgi:hypothetical protein
MKRTIAGLLFAILSAVCTPAAAEDTSGSQEDKTVSVSPEKTAPEGITADEESSTASDTVSANDPGHDVSKQQLFAEQCTSRLTVRGSPYKKGECRLSDGLLSVTLTPYSKYRSNIESIISGEIRKDALEGFCQLFNQTSMIDSIEYRFLDEQGNIFKLIQLQRKDCRTKDNE